jgi:hypothetical protein
MSETPREPVPGPLDQLFPGLRQRAERVAALPVHPRVVHARDADGRYAIVLASFAAAAQARALHAALKPLIEAALLSDLCRSVEVLAEDRGAPRAVELYEFAAPSFDPSPAYALFALAPRPVSAPEAVLPLSLLRREAQLVTGAPSDEPHARWTADWILSAHPLADALEAHLRAHGPRVPWGREPGLLARLAADFLAARGHPGVEPSRAGIELLERVVVHATPFALRGIGAASFQALCDLVAVFAASHDDLEVAWGVCEADEQSELVPPPVLRLTRGEETWHVPLGEHVLRWCIMPAAPGESIPTLGAWAEHEFA